jgi:hypothetical protein
VSEQQQSTFEGWAILELMGHRKLGGYLREEQIGGASFIRIDVPAYTVHNAWNRQTEERLATTQYYSPSAIYAITPCSEDVAVGLAEYVAYQPVTRYELPSPRELLDRDAEPEIDEDDEL